jgi:hypothetical protein
MVAPHHIPLLLILSTFFASGLASDSFNDFSDNIDNAEEDGIEPSRFQKFIAKFEQEQQMNLEEEEMVGESSPKVTRQVSDEPLQQVERHTRQSNAENEVIQGGVDFSQATRLPDGRLCVVKEESVETFAKDPILECTHKDVEKCHYTYITYFKPTQEESCEENFEKKCQITFRQEAMQEMVRKCYRPIEKVCNGQGSEECQTIYESSCTTKYIDDGQGGFVGDTRCEKRPVEICGAGCVLEEGPEECHDKTVDTLVDVPEEQCDLNPQKTCRLITKLVPSLKPKQECTTVPKEVCVLKFTQPELRAKPLRTEWCLDEAGAASEAQAEYGAEPQAEYGSSARRGRVVSSSSNRNSINNRVNNNNNRGNNNRAKSNRIVGSGSNSQVTINSNRLAANGNGGARGGNGNRNSKNNRGSGNNRANNRVSSSRLVNNNNNRGSPPRIVANGNRIVGIGSQVVNSGGVARPLPVSNSINLSNINNNNRASNSINRALPIGSAPFTRPAQVSGGVQPTTTFRKFSG